MTIFRSAAAMLAGLGALLLAPAAAQAADYQVYRDGNCPANFGCSIDFARVPAGKTLRIDHVSCYLRFDFDGVELVAAQLVLLNANGSRAFAVTPSLLKQDDPQIAGDTEEEVFVSNDTIRAVARPGQRFRAYAVVHKDSDGTPGTVSQLSCGISGTLN